MNLNGKMANEVYCKEKGKLLTNLIVSGPVIDEFGFSVALNGFMAGEKESFTLKVEAGEAVSVTKDMAACIVSALVLQKYRNILFNFDVGENTLKECAEITRAVVNADTVRQDEPREARDKWAVNISGGVDSTALALLCPGLPKAVVCFTPPSTEEDVSDRGHIDGGGLAAATNASEFLFPHYSAGYYNLGALLYADSECIEYALDGRLMTDSLLGHIDFLNGKADAPMEVIDLRPLAYTVYGVTVLYPFIGMTRAGTQKILYNVNPALYQQMMGDYGALTLSREEAAARRTLKLLIQNAVTGTEPDKQLTDFNFYAPYLVKKLGPQVMADSADGDKLLELRELIAPLNLDFYEKYDKNALRGMPEDFAAYFLERLEAAGVELYSDEDYEERAIITGWLTGQGGE